MIPPLTKWINDIKVKLGFSRTMTAAGADVVDAVNKHSDQIEELDSLATGVITPTGLINYNSLSHIEKRGNIVEMYLRFTVPSTPISGSGTIIASIPSAFVPIGPCVIYAFKNSSGNYKDFTPLSINDQSICIFGSVTLEANREYIAESTWIYGG